MNDTLQKLRVPRQALLFTTRGNGIDNASRAVRRQYERGALRRLGRGAYIDPAVWSTLDDRSKHVAYMQAAQARHRTQLVFCCDSAAALLNYPAYGYFGSVVHAASPTPRRSVPLVRWHQVRLSDDDIVECDGFLITSPMRTLLDIARTTRFGRAVGMVDAGVRTRRHSDDRNHAPRVDLEHLRERNLQFARAHGFARAENVLHFARDGADSLGESISRVQEYQLGFPEPELQVAVRDDEGLIGEADQAWPEFRLLGEFDGLTKYTRDAYTKGRSIEDIVFSEKVREDRMRATSQGMARWLWADAHVGQRLSEILVRAGLPRDPRPRSDWRISRH
ncbi:hypothetical protein [Paramicrobacterium chengjingii]|uniref:Transcriptional regulator, AbiEi antitoxin, Type IV TA system n=1 Tax=Paramicrobacterium chengjingii TaxID=2769067 RepID=A0ABX6YIA0_9MICO|nr:hypothetical protein [Microbacterium chengjingii]QPZ38435.1 hypothetical protein HCR76_16895 [Microbacterium chengjingii]